SPEVLQAMRPQRLDARERRQVIAAEVVRRFREERLAAVAGREQACDPVERRAEVVAVAHIDCARMKRHSYAELRRFGPRLAMERALRLERRGERVGRRVERRAKRVTAGLDRKSTRLNSSHQIISYAV